METVSEISSVSIWKRRLKRVDEGIYKYQDKDGAEKFAVKAEAPG